MNFPDVFVSDIISQKLWWRTGWAGDDWQEAKPTTDCLLCNLAKSFLDTKFLKKWINGTFLLKPETWAWAHVFIWSVDPLGQISFSEKNRTRGKHPEMECNVETSDDEKKLLTHTLRVCQFCLAGFLKKNKKWML